MPIIGLSLIIQIALAIHVIKTGRDRYWIYILLMPGIGPILYFVTQVLPDSEKNYKSIQKDMLFDGEKIGNIVVHYDDSAILDSMNKIHKDVIKKEEKFALDVEEKKSSSQMQAIIVSIILPCI